MERDGLVFVERKPNLDALAQMGMTVATAEKIIFSLTAGNYSRGPECDDDGSQGEIWFFTTDQSGHHLYIKLKLDRSAAKCLSFHPTERPLPRPYR